MPDFCRHIFFGALLFFSVPVFSQQQVPLADSVSAILEPPADADSATTVFNTAAQPTPVAVRSVPKKLVDSLRKDDDFWYANAAPQKKKTPDAGKASRKGGLLQLGWFRQLLWLLILSAFLGVVFWYLHASNIFIFRRNAKKIAGDDEAAGESDDIFTLNYNKEILAAEAQQNYRLAVRLRYLQTLKELADRHLIDYSYGRTNSDYVTQLNKSSYHRDFFRLTRNFEYTWYGQFDLSAAAYSMMRNDFSTFQNGLR